jgi:hypothetical protein
MIKKISRLTHLKMQNLIIQIFKYIYLSLKILIVVAGGHGSTRD